VRFHFFQYLFYTVCIHAPYSNGSCNYMCYVVIYRSINKSVKFFIKVDSYFTLTDEKQSAIIKEVRGDRCAMTTLYPTPRIRQSLAFSLSPFLFFHMLWRCEI
jgi:hypothetical protein